MARRVNTKFVIVLGGALGVGALTVLGIMARNSWMYRDPDHWKGLADKALEEKNLTSAVQYYAMAANASSRDHRPGTDALYTRLGDLSIQLSGQTTSVIDSNRYYNQAMDAWKRALTENASYVPAREKLIKEQYKLSDYGAGAAFWTSLEESASKLVSQDKRFGKAFTYLAAARLHLLEISATTGVDAKRGELVEQNIQTAMKEDANSPQPWVLQAELLQLRATHMPAGSGKEVKKLIETGIASLQSFLKDHPNNPDASMAVARLYWGLRQPDEAMKVMQAAVAAQPADVRMANLLAEFYKNQRAFDKGEKVLQDLTAVAPTDPDAFLSLARYEQDLRKPADAMAAYRKTLELPQVGGGIASELNIRRQVESLFALGWLSMDVALDKRAHKLPNEEKEAINQASDYLTKLRASPSSKGLQDLLEGRLQLIGGNSRKAIAALTAANKDLGKTPNLGQWLKTKQTLAQAHEMLEEWGNAEIYVKEILEQYPGLSGVVLEKAMILNKEARGSEALALIQPFTDPAPGVQVPADLQKAAWRVQADAYLSLRMEKEYKAVMEKIGGTDSLLAVVRNKISTGDLTGALEEDNRILADAPDNLGALTLAVAINVRLDHREAAAAILKKATELYPKNNQLQVLSVLLSKPGADLKETQLSALEAIEDPYTRHMAKAQYYAQLNDRTNQIQEFEAASKAMEELNTPRAREVVSDISDEIFMQTLSWAQQAQGLATAAETRAKAAKDPAEKAKALQEKADQEAASHKYFDQAELYTQRAERLNLDSVDGKLYRGRLEFAKGGDNRKLGIQILEQAVAARTSNPVGHTVLGEAYFLSRGPKNNYADKALEEFRLAIQQKPDNGLALRFAMELLIDKGDTHSVDEAKGYLTKALAFTPHDPELQRFNDVLGDVANSIMTRERLFKSNPGDLSNVKRLGILYVRQGLPERAADMLKILMQHDPDNLDLADTYAHLEHEAHHDNDALTAFERFTASSDPAVSFRALLKLGDMFRLLDKPDIAMAKYHDALAKESPGVDDAECRIGDLYFDMNDMKNAETTYRTVYAKTPKKDIRVLRRLVESLVRQSKFKDADVMIDALFAQHPDDSDGWILRAFSLLRQQQAPKAIECLDHVLKAHPDNIEALHYRAYALFTTQGNIDQAMEDLKTVRARDPNRIDSRLLLAQVFRRARQFTEAADEYETVIQKQSDTPAFRVEYAQFLLSVAEVQKRLSEDNTSDFASNVRSVRAEPRLLALLQDSSKRFGNLPVWQILQGSLLNLKDRPADALNAFKAAFNTPGGEMQAAMPYISSLYNAGNYEEVIKVTTGLIAQVPGNGDLYLKRGAAYAKINKIDEAMADFSHALAIVGDLDSYLVVVHAAEAVQLSDKVTALLTEKSKADPKDVRPVFGLADIDLAAKRPTDAITLLTPWMADPKFPDRILLLRMMGMAKYMAKDSKGAYEAYLEFLKLAPNDLEVLNNIAFLVAEDLKKPKEGLAYADRAVKILEADRSDIAFVNNGNVYDTRGWVKYLCGDFNGAIFDLKRALQIEAIPVGYLHLAKANQAAKDLAKARTAVAQGIAVAKEKKDPVLSDLEALSKELGT